MYDFYYGNKEQILNDPERYLIFIKRLMPRWINGIPDSELIAIWKILNKQPIKNPVLIETGSGASSIALFLYAALNDGCLYTWDMNNARGSELKSLISETVCRDLGFNINDVWKFIAFNSVDPYLGIDIIKEFNQTIDFAFFDSLHTLDHLMNEIKAAADNMSETGFIAIDDGNYNCKYANYSYINILRNKLGLNSVEEPEDNLSGYFFNEVEGYLKDKFSRVIKLEDDYKKEYQNDLFFQYFEIDKNVMNKMGMENLELLAHRFDAWQIQK